MSVAKFGKVPPIQQDDISDDDFLRVVKNHFNVLPGPIKKLFSFNTKAIIYGWNCGYIRNPVKAYVALEFFFREKPCIKLNAYGLTEAEEIDKVLLHELGHTLDPGINARFSGYRFSRDYFPSWLYREVNFQKWIKILRQEPHSAESCCSVSQSLSEELRRPWEQWASRIELTLMVDYMIPTGLARSDNLAIYNPEMSALKFKSGWPKSYKFFHRYIKMLLRHAPK